MFVFQNADSVLYFRPGNVKILSVLTSNTISGCAFVCLERKHLTSGQTITVKVVLSLLLSHREVFDCFFFQSSKTIIIFCSQQDLATTPLYCEPKDFSSTSSTISNTVSDPEYAVPDVAIGSSLANPNLRPLAAQSYHSSSGGHLNSNLNMFGANFTRIFASNLKAPGSMSAVSSSATLAPQSVNKNSTSNVAYSTQKFPVYSVDGNQLITSTANGSSYSVNRVLANARQMQGQHYQNSMLSGDAMTSNTIYNNNK